MESNKFKELAAVDVGAHIEKKGGMSYLSWPFAVDALMRHDPQATWEFLDPVSFGKTLMVSCRVTAFGKTMQMHLPVMDNRNKAIADPDAFEVNKAMMRCLVKCIAVHGLGLYIYAGEDLPVDDCEHPHVNRYARCHTIEELQAAFGADYQAAKDMGDRAAAVAAKADYEARKEELTK